MKEATWEQCRQSKSAVPRVVNSFKIDSLIMIANERISLLQQMSAKGMDAKFIFEGYYSSLLELLHALVLSRGFIVQNHICLGYFLRDVLKSDKLFRAFDDCRKRRNGLLYYGEQMPQSIALESIDICIKLIREIKEILP